MVAGARSARGGGADRPPAVLRQLEHALDREHRHRRCARPRGRAGRCVEALPESDILRAELDSFRGGRSEGSWENFLYFVARDYWDARGEEGRAERAAAEKACGVTHLRSKTALRVAAQIMPLAKSVRRSSTRGWATWTPRRCGVAGDDRQHRLSARRGGVQHPARGRRGPRRAARRLRARQGGDAQRGRRRRDDLQRRPRRALRFDVLARQRLRFDDLAPTCGSARGWTTNARSRSSRRSCRTAPTSTSTTARRSRSSRWRPARTAAPSTRSPSRIAIPSARPSTSPSFRSTSGSSTTPLTRPTRRPATLGARGLSYYGMDSTYASSLAILRRILRLEGALD